MSHRRAIKLWLLEKGACGSEDPELFFPIGTTGPAQRQVEEAKRVCRRCEVAEDCLEWALRTGQAAGVWGGMSEEERRALGRRSGRGVPVEVRSVSVAKAEEF